ncbi:TonB-dependent receptor [Shewanella glacialimarina]|nr:TonB-dependent receptor [Shewanella glacialimarina]
MLCASQLKVHWTQTTKIKMVIREYYHMKKTQMVLAIKMALLGVTVSSSGIVYAAEVAEGANNKVERIAVTGSRIKRTDLETAQPLLNISREDIDRSGLSSLSNLLKEVSTNGASLGLQTNNGNTGGAATVSLRNCGSARTLVLINGRRWIPQLGGNVDVSTIPLAAVERIEILKDGAAANYGTDAICGVVNVITRNDFEGAEFAGTIGGYEQGGGQQETASITLGSQGEKTSILMNVAYTQQQEILGGERDISSVPIYNLPANISGSGGRASPTTPYGQYTATVDGVKGSYTLDPNKEGCVANQDCTSVGDFRLYDRLNDGYNFAPVNYVQQPSETTSLYLQAAHLLSDDITAKADVMYSKRSSEAQLAAQPMGGLAISKDSTYNPFDQDIIGGSFRPIVAPRSFSADVDTWRVSGGLEGDFELADRSFYWDAFAAFSETSSVFLKNGFFDTNKVKKALGASSITNGVATCNGDAACVPLNIFGGPDGVTPEMLKYISVSPRNLASQSLHNYGASLGGDIVELPAGMLAMVAGVEYQRHAGYDSPDPLTVAGQVLGDNAAQPTEGGFSVSEAFAETAIPLLADLPFIKKIELNAAVRVSDYSNFGNTTNPSFKLTYSPNDDLMFRASTSDGFRAPSLTNLYSGQNDSRPSATDPCDIDSVAYTNSAQTRANCLAAGVSPSFKQKDPQFRAKVGGNPELQPETSTSKILGFVYNPSQIENLGLTLDWYNVQIENAIGTNTAQSIADRCYIQGISQYCGLINRDMVGTLNGNPGEISNLLALSQNFVGGLETEGYDLNVTYQFTTSIGEWQVNWDSTYVDYAGDIGKPNRGEVNVDGNISDGNYVGKLTPGASGGGSEFRVKSNLTLGWNNDDFFASVTAQFLSKQTENCSNVITVATGLNQPELRDLCSNPDNMATSYAFKPGTTEVVATEVSAPENELSPTVYFDTQAGWNTPWESTVSVGIRNLFDKEPPLAYSAFANTYDPSYRIPGRYLYASFKQRF